MTVLIAPPPFPFLSMSTMQASSRRLSARLQEKDGAQPQRNGAHTASELPKESAKNHASASSSRKRKNAYDEDDDGFTFSRVKKNKKPQESKGDAAAVSLPTVEEAPAIQKRKRSDIGVEPSKPVSQNLDIDMAVAPTKRRNKKMSFSTPGRKESQPVRRSKRLSNDSSQPHGSPTLVPAPSEIKVKKKEKIERPKRVEEEHSEKPSPQESGNENNKQVEHAEQADSSQSATLSATKIALPFADTPVIRRNKAMREGKSTKGDRRSSLGLRGRRASSLIDSGNSNALPHQEVEIPNFYKHIESDLMEPRRMRQLLTWCATRAIHAKPKGTGFEDASVKSAARIIEEELLKELSNKSELSDWFSREDAPESAKPLPEKANPKNVQNAQKIAELQEQISRLKAERDALEALLQPPEIRESDQPEGRSNGHAQIDRSLLSDEDVALLDSLQSSQLAVDIPRRINKIASNLGPCIDTFADKIHKIAQYRSTADTIAGKVLSTCADRLADREREGRKKALGIGEDRSPGRDLSSVLRGLSKADR